jgi:hypothetical protein
MTEKELKKLNRKQLLELLLKQTEYSESLEKKLEDLERKLEDKLLIETEAGSIAEASLKLNGVFEAAQAAADQYLENIKRIYEKRKEIFEKSQESESSPKEVKPMAEETPKAKENNNKENNNEENLDSIKNQEFTSNASKDMSVSKKAKASTVKSKKQNKKIKKVSKKRKSKKRN